MKGTPKIVSEEITEQQFHDALHHNKTHFCNFNKIRAKDHKVETVCIRRRAMTGFDGIYILSILMIVMSLVDKGSSFYRQAFYAILWSSPM